MRVVYHRVSAHVVRMESDIVNVTNSSGVNQSAYQTLLQARIRIITIHLYTGHTLGKPYVHMDMRAQSAKAKTTDEGPHCTVAAIFVISDTLCYP